jgi:hypothetical protein
VAVCLQALAAAGLLPPCWEGTGYGEPAEAAGESGTGCLAVPLGCRQLVALMQEKTKDQVSGAWVHVYACAGRTCFDHAQFRCSNGLSCAAHFLLLFGQLPGCTYV